MGSSYSHLQQHADVEDGAPVASPPKEDRANFFSRLFFFWADPLVRLGAKRPLEETDLEEFPETLHAATTDGEFQAIWKQTSTDLKPRPLIRALFRYARPCLVGGFFFKLCAACSQLSAPLALRMVLESMENPSGHGIYSWALALFLCAIGQAYSLQHLYWFGFKHALRFRNLVMSAVFRKMMRLSPAARQATTNGQMMNLISVDSWKLMDFIWNPQDVWTAPFMITVCVATIFYLAGVSAFPALVFVGALFPANLIIARIGFRINEQLLKVSDERINMVNQTLQNVKFVKYYAWEEAFRQDVARIRLAELALLRKLAILRACSNCLWTVAPALVSLVTFAVYSLLGGVLTPQFVFPLLAVINNLKDPISKFTDVMHETLKARLATTRIEAFLLLEEVDKPPQVKGAKYAVDVDADFSYDMKAEQPLLKGLRFHVARGALQVVVGPVGSGKSSVVSALLGEMKKVRGKVELSGRVVCTTAQAWLLNATLRDNILFGLPYDKEKYDRVILACALTKDIEMLPAGDMTEIGERGINLSGGQKQRVALARAAYQDDAEIYVFDEPLGALDSTVARWVFDECILGLLKDKTRILVTHQLQFLPSADSIIVMKDLTIQHVGTYEQLNAQVDFASIVASRNARLAKAQSNSDLIRAARDAKAGIEANGKGPHATAPEHGQQQQQQEEAVKRAKKLAHKIIEEEEREKGGISRHIYKDYVSSGNKIMFVLVVVGYLTSQGFRMASDLWLAEWASESSNASDPHGEAYWLGFYALLFLLYAVLVLARELVLVFSCLECGRNLHVRMFDCMLRAPMAFFDSVPIGRIINRFSRDQRCIDESLMNILSDVGSCGVIVLSVVVLVCILSPFLVAPVLVIGALYWLVQRFYRRTSRELKRMDAVSLSPIYAHFSETSNGAATVRAYHQQRRFLTEFFRRIDGNGQIFYWHVATNRWLGVRLELVGSAIILSTALVTMFTSTAGMLETSLAGLSLAYTLSLTSNLNWAVRQYTEMEISMNAVARVLQYTEVPPEAPLVIEDSRPPPDWPRECNIDLRKLFLRYRADLDFVLKGVTCHINGKEKIGIVGRTGAGKSSLTSAFFRLVEPSSGEICIDGLDVSKIGLHDLRSKLSIIPQDPVLFHGTIRKNLDPFDAHTDDELWQALEKSKLRPFVQSQPLQLATLITENGENLSLGQRQLLCLCRAVLRNSKILILDEATASLDLETDQLIQETVRAVFAECTVLTIAHRLDTIIQSDRIMVFDEGYLKEMDAPEVLLSRQDSIFSQLVRSTFQATEQRSPSTPRGVS